ncbi:MAG: hypothetical protein GVY26_22520, partial [Bacteroidetes bacterium]|nr:hypothetical protein [Bacteroidota bacterium]
RTYLENYPNGEFRSSAVSRIRKIEAAAARQREDLAWQIALEKNTKTGFEEYLDEYPEGRYAGQARAKQEALEKPADAQGGMAWAVAGKKTIEQLFEKPESIPSKESFLA